VAVIISNSAADKIAIIVSCCNLSAFLWGLHDLQYNRLHEGLGNLILTLASITRIFGAYFKSV